MRHFPAQIRAIAGGGYEQGGRGTIYLEDRTTGRTTLRVNNENVDGPKPAVVTDLTSTIYQFTFIDLGGYGHVLFRDPGKREQLAANLPTDHYIQDDTVIVTPSMMIGDSRAQLCTRGTVNATAVSTILAFGFCTYGNGHLLLPPSITLFSTRVSIQGQLSGVTVSVFVLVLWFLDILLRTSDCKERQDWNCGEWARLQIKHLAVIHSVATFNWTPTR